MIRILQRTIRPDGNVIAQLEEKLLESKESDMEMQENDETMTNTTEISTVDGSLHAARQNDSVKFRNGRASKPRASMGKVNESVT